MSKESLGVRINNIEYMLQHTNTFTIKDILKELTSIRKENKLNGRLLWETIIVFFQNVQNVEKGICCLFHGAKMFLKSGSVLNADILCRRGNFLEKASREIRTPDPLLTRQMLYH